MMRQNNISDILKFSEKKAWHFVLVGAAAGKGYLPSVLTLMLILGSIIGLASCDRNKDDAASGGSAGNYEIDKTIERGPVTVHLKIGRTEMTTADRLSLRLEASTDDAYEVDLPKAGEKLGSFTVVDSDSPSPSLIGRNKILFARSYELEPYLAGEYKIPPMKVVFWKKDDSKKEKHEFETEEIAIKVKSLLSGKTGEAKIKELVPPMAIPGLEGKWFWICAVGIGLMALCGTGAIVYKRHRNRDGSAAEVRLPAHEIARRQLDELLAERLIEQGYIKMFYIRISDILRRYIENRFSLHAPERTTDEFLAELHQSIVLADSHKRLLKEFLNHCDLVKFAEFQPISEEVQKTITLCKQFIEETRPNEKEEGAEV